MSQYSNTPALRYPVAGRFQYSSFSSRVFQDFFSSCITIEDAAQAVFTKGDHAQLDGLLAHHNGRGALVDEGANGVVDDQQLIDAFAPFVAGVVAGGATAAIIEDFLSQVMHRQAQERKLVFGRFKRRAATLADGAHQALAQDGDEGRGNQKGLDTHVNEPGDGAGGVVGVKGAQDEVPGEGSLDGDLSGLQVTHFTDHDDVRVLAEKGTESFAEGQADAFVDG